LERENAWSAVLDNEGAVCLSQLTSRTHWRKSDRNVCVAETQELVERDDVEAQETALHRPTQVSPYS
jgi:hypothetical protein